MLAAPRAPGTRHGGPRIARPRIIHRKGSVYVAVVLGNRGTVNTGDWFPWPRPEDRVPGCGYHHMF